MKDVMEQKNRYSIQLFTLDWAVCGVEDWLAPKLMEPEEILGSLDRAVGTEHRHGLLAK